MLPAKYKSSTEGPDGGYGWIVVVSAFMVSFLTDGIIFSFGLILVQLVDDFGLSRASTALVGSIMNSFGHLIGPVAGSVLDMYGGRGVVIAGTVISFIGVFSSYFVQSFYILYVTYGVIAGTGMGLMYAPANACVIKHFTRRRTLAQGIAMCGTGFGTFVMNLLGGYLIQTYGWRGAILISSALLLNGIPCGLVLRPQSRPTTEVVIAFSDYTTEITPDGTTKETPDNATDEMPDNSTEESPMKESHPREYSFKSTCKELVDFSALRDYRCLFFLGSTFVINLAFALPFSFLPDQVAQDGVSAYKASWLVSTIGFTNTISRIVNGYIGDRPWVNRVVMFESFVFFCGIALAVSPVFKTFETKIIFSCLYGICIGGYIILLPVVLADIFGKDVIGKSFGLNRFVIGLADLIAAPIGGWIFDSTGSYTLTFVIAGCEYVVGGILLVCPSIIQRCRRKL